MRERLYFFYIALMTFWVLTFIGACWCFVIVYATEMWYFKGAVRKSRYFGLSSFPVLARYHLGSMCLSGFLVNIVHPLRLIVGIVTATSRRGSSRKANSQRCCSSLTEFYWERLDFLGQRAYMDIALNSANFFDAAHYSVEVSRSQLETVQAVHAACGVFQAVGLILVFILARGLANAMLSGKLEIHGLGVFAGLNNIAGGSALEAASLLCALSASFVAHPFLMLFDTICDTILYCATVEQMRADSKKRAMDEEGHPLTGMLNYVTGYLAEAVRTGCGGTRPGIAMERDQHHGGSSDGSRVSSS